MSLKKTLVWVAVLGGAYWAYSYWKRKQYKEVIEDGSFTIYVKE
jgi:hypothetical protein